MAIVLHATLRIQAVYYVLGGLWPLLHLGSFEWVTGPKVDDWLVRTVALLTLAIGVSIWAGARTQRPIGAIVFLACATAASYAAIDVTYALAGRISAVYLLDAAAEVVLLIAVLASWLRMRRSA